MNLTALVPLPYRILALSMFAAALVAFGYVKGASHEQHKQDAINLAQSETNNKAILAAVSSNDKAHALDLQQTQKVVTNYESTIDIKNAQITAARADANTQRMRIDRASICGSAAATSQAASAINPDVAGAPVTVDLPEEIAGRIRDAGESADREVARLQTKVTGLQAWIITHGFYGDISDDFDQTSRPAAIH